MEAHRGEIFHLYIVQNKPLSEVRAILKRDHGLDISPKVFKTHLGRWGYKKNVNRSEVLEILHQRSCREREGKDSIFTLRKRPVDLEKVRRHGQRAALHNRQPGNLLLSSQSPSRDVVSRTPPPPLRQSLPIVEQCRIPEKLLYDFDVLVKSSFENGRWRFNGNNLIINSSPSEPDEKRSLHDFLGNIINGQDAVKAGDSELAGACWRHAFIGVESLVRSQYHDVIPNLIQQINNLSRNGLGDLAGLLKTHVARCSETFLGSSDGPTPSIFHD
ncbi:hypothetical protein HD806DRAFT_544236 [Xylariaceae sp. AK1471]|nr:hypothetical protein HD806DRAFT_544236 [Xylariaceae sp. AK1471]